ncbi:asparagine synthase-related protein [uncultured Methanobacterium sp.]|uniref:asparagine synthase-related protein n=1 Tax=uncultured Methanobacterium sp. TaxID=176306 RepID=UPI002AA85805|nr:asparagine synthase-related protein [uncultured Methanobacterium sp.]
MLKKIYDSQGSLTNINSFSLIFHKHDERDEKTYIDSITNFVNTTPIFIYGDTINLLDDVDNILSHQEQPLMIPNIRIIWELYNKMEHQGIRVSLGGSGGDSIISFGHYYFRDLFISFKWKKLLKEIYYYSKTSNKKIFNIFLYNLVFVLIPLSIKKLVKKHQTIIPGPIVLNKKFSKQLNAEKCWENFSLDYFKANTAKKNHLHAIENANIYMLEMRDRASAVFSIEQRYPFLDKRLVEFCYSIPTEMKFKYGWNRYILRLAMEGILPEMNQWRTDKANLNSLYKENMLLEKNNLNKIFLSKNNLIEHYINYDKITEIYRNFINGIQVSDSPYSIWLIYQLYQWLKKEKLI